MRPVSVMALFCEDIREEKNDIFTLVGILPDTINLTDPPGVSAPPEAMRVLAKLCAYIRVNFDPDFDLGTPQAKLLLPNGNIIAAGTIEDEVVRKAQSDAKAKGNVLAGVILRLVMAGFRPPAGETIRLEVDIKGETYLAAALTFKLAQ